MIKYLHEVIIVLKFIFSLTIIDWLNNNYWWPVLLFVVSMVIIVRIIMMRPKQKKAVDVNQYYDEVVQYLGGIANITSAALDGSRVKFQIQEIEQANLDGFKALGATGVFISGRNVKMVLPFDAKDLVDKINIEINGG